jgi:hypothetical protein
MSACQNCKHWLKEKRRVYSDGTCKTFFSAEANKGRCEELSIETPPDFSCAMFKDGAGWDHVETDKVEGESWQHWEMGPCPNCRGAGSHPVEMRPACDRCAGTGKVRYYEDGFIGEERTRRHPKEPPSGAPQIDAGTVVQLLPSAKSAVIG